METEQVENCSVTLKVLFIWVLHWELRFCSLLILVLKLGFRVNVDFVKLIFLKDYLNVFFKIEI